MVGDVLAEGDRLAELQRVEFDLVRQLDLQPRIAHAASGAPISVRVGVEHAGSRVREVAAAGAHAAALQQVAGEPCRAPGGEALQRGDVFRIEQAVAVRRHVEQQLAVAAHGAEVQLHQAVG
ncbi:MAG TPA: hypothetical protein VF738_01040 [Rhodanobacter sp.]